MKKKPSRLLEGCRERSGPYASTKAYGNNGRFILPNGAGPLLTMASDQAEWDHVSVSFGPLARRCPTWEEMCYVKELFFRVDEWAMQLHPPRPANISVHDYCLHLWRPNDGGIIPLPPRFMV